MASDPTKTEPLQFDTAVPQVASGEPRAAETGVTCTACQRPITDAYFDVNGQSVCESCRNGIVQELKTPQGWGVFVRAAVFGLVAAILGAVLYYAVIAITKFEIGIVAIAIGFMVGYGIRMGTKGRGGRRFQVLALLLTYWAVGLAYTPFLFRGNSGQGEETSQSATTTDAPSAASTADQGAEREMNVPVAMAFLLAFSLALPVVTIFSSMPGGLLSAAIIAFGMHQAWRMTGAPQLEITGPYRIASGQIASA